MSWQSWVDNIMAYTPVNVAAIYGLDGSVWAKSETCVASDAEIKAVIGGLNASTAGEFSAFHFQGSRYMTIRLESGELDGRTRSSCFSAAKSTQCVIVGAFVNPENDPSKAAGQGDSQKVNLAVAKLKQALAAVGY